AGGLRRGRGRGLRELPGCGGSGSARQCADACVGNAGSRRGDHRGRAGLGGGGMNVLVWLRRRLAERLKRSEEGSAVVEFLGAALILLIPVVYLIVALGQVQAATFAADTAAREAGRVIAGADTFGAGTARAATAVELAFADQGFTVEGEEVLQVVCQSDPCLSPGAYVHLQVATAVDLPLVPDFLAEELGTQVHIEAEARKSGT